MSFGESLKECRKIILELRRYNVKNVKLHCGFGNHFDLVVDGINLISGARIDVIHVLLHGMQQGIISYKNANSPYNSDIEKGWGYIDYTKNW